MIILNTISLCTELKAGEQPPEWIELLPAGPDIKGRDGRSWKLSTPQKVIEAFNGRGGTLVIDYEHASEVAAPKGIESPAAGWIEEVQIKPDGSVWGKVDWTKRASNSIVEKEYRFVSPAFSHTSDGEIVRLISVALTNKPNLELTALNSEQSWEAVAIALGVEKVESPQDILNALNREKTISNDKIVNEYIERAVFCPAQRESLIAMCSQIGVDGFKEFASTQELQGKTFKHVLGERTTTTTYPRETLTEAQIAVCRATGVSEEKYLTALGKEK